MVFLKRIFLKITYGFYTGMNKKQKLEYFKKYYTNVSGSMCRVELEGDKIVIYDVLKPYPEDFTIDDIVQVPYKMAEKQKEVDKYKIWFLIELPTGHSFKNFYEYETDNYQENVGIKEGKKYFSNTFDVNYVDIHYLYTEFADKFKKGGKVAKTWKEKYNKKYGYDLDESHSLADISKKTGVSKKGLQKIYNKGIGAWKTNIGSVRLKKSFKKDSDTKKFPRNKRLGKEQWAKARVYSAVMGGKAAKVDAKELKMDRGGDLATLTFSNDVVPKHQDYIDNRSRGVFKNYNVEQLLDIPFPENNSDETKYELIYLNSLPKDIDYVFKHDRIFEVFFDYLRENNLELSSEDIDELYDLTEHAKPIIYEVKYHYNRPRPYQIAQMNQTPLEFVAMRTTKTPSYPSGHSIQGMIVGNYLADKFPDHYDELIDIGNHVGISRLIGRVHHPTDDIFGKYIGESLYSFYKANNE